MENSQLSLFKSFPGYALLLDARSCNFTILAATNRLLEAWSLEEISGRGLFEAFSTFWPEEVLTSALAESLSFVLQNEEKHPGVVLNGGVVGLDADRHNSWRVTNTPHINDRNEIDSIILSFEKVRSHSEISSRPELRLPYRDWINNTPDAAVSFDTEGRFIYANSALAALAECTLQELLETTFLPFIAPEDLHRCLDHFGEALNGRPQSYRVTAITAKGKRLPIEIVNFPLIEDNKIAGVCGIIKDITEQVRAQQQFQSLIHTINGIVWEADPQTREITFISSQAEKLLGYPVDGSSVDSKFWTDHIHPEDRTKMDWHLYLSQKEPFEFEYRMIAADGRTIWLKDYVSPIHENGQLASLRGILVDITESKRIEKELKESEDSYRNLITNSLDGVYKTTPEGRFLEANPALVDMLGYDSVDELLAIDIKTQLYFDSADRESALLEELHVEMAEFRLKRKDGSEVWVEDHGQVVLDENGRALYHTGIIRDVTERKKAEALLAESRAALLRSNERFTYASRATADAIWDWDLKTNQVFREARFSEITGYSVDEINSKDFIFSDRVHPDDMADARREIEKILAGEADSFATEFRFRKADGSYAFVIDRGIAVRDAEGAPYRVIGALQDVTEQKLGESERERLIQTLTVNNKDLQQFSYITSHNLKAPLANMMGILSLLDTSKIDDEEVLMWIDGLSKSTYQLNETVEDLVKILVIKESVNIDQELLALEDIWKKVENLTSGLIKTAGAEVSLDFSGAPEVYFNNTYLESILINLFSNALKYRADDRKCRIQICSKEEDDHVLLLVKDNGLGIDLQRYDKRIFGLYQRFHNHPDSRGLGLYIIASQIKALGGKIEVESTVNEGTCFKVYFKKEGA